VEAAPAAGTDALWALLRGGGQVVLIRHGATSGGAGDPAGFRLDDCTTQRNLNDRGRADARRIGAAFRARGIPVARVVSSPWCRCLETARLAFGGTPEVWDALRNAYVERQDAPERTRRLREALTRRPEGGNLVYVTHGANISAAVGVHPGEGELVIVTPGGPDGFRVAGRIPPSSLD
ncbi:MAG TPA: histidine phosphatase family protein, partial [Candidatus Tectomicrobia bacterium]|nr:histidine phosphatase family protein [Candidatus Tectomicrobia bacterium]